MLFYNAIYACNYILLSSPGNPSLCKVIDGHFDRYLVAGENFNIVHTKLTRNMCGNYVLIGKLNLEYGVWQCFYNRTLKFYNIVFWQNNPSLSVNS